MTRAASGPEWSGDMLDQPEMMAAFTGQLRRALAEYADYVAHIRRDAEAMWEENPPDGYSSFEAWWRHARVAGPFAEIQQHIEAAAKLTFRLEARYRRNRHEIPDRRQAAAEAKLQAALPPAGQPVQSRPARPRAAPAQDSGEDFMDTIRRDGRTA